MRRFSKKTAAFLFAALLAILVGLIAATMGIGKVSLPEGAVAFVDDVSEGEVTQEDFDAAIEQASARAGGQTPEPGTPQFDQQIVPALSDLLLARWVAGEAEERDIEIEPREIETELQSIIDEQFGGQKEFEKFLEDSGFSEEDALERVELQLLTQCIQDRVIPQDPEAEQPAVERQGCQGEEEIEITDDEIQSFYDENISQFETPETRDVRQLINQSEEKAQQAFDELSADPTAENWKAVTKELSTDEATKDLGGLRQGVAEGQNEPAIDEAIFGSEVGEVVGPIESETGFYITMVEKVNPAETQPLDEATTQQIRSQLVTQEQQQAVTEFQDAFVAKWRARTVCSEDLIANDDDGTIQSQLAERCSNFSVTDDGCVGDDDDDELPVDPITGEQQTEPTGCGMFVAPRLVVPPVDLASAASDPAAVVTAAPGAALPQGVQRIPDAEAAPPGALPTGLEGAPPGTVPPGTAPPGTTAPPTGAPPTGAPPTGVPPG